MPRAFLLLLLVSLAAMAASIRLHLKDGSYQAVREYEVKEDRVRYYSAERGEWEEIPTEMVDLDKTRKEVAAREAASKEESKILDAEDRAIRQQENEAARVPQEKGVYYVDGKSLTPIKQGESKVHTKKGRSVLKVITPIPVVNGKGIVEMDGEKSAFSVSQARPEFYIRLTQRERFGIIRLRPQKGIRVVEDLTMIPVTRDVVEERDNIDIFRREVDDGLFKIWPEKDLEPGEYAVVEFAEGKLNIQIWDFSYKR